ncbi:glutathione Stransferase [Perkinsus chesapeaki]|uniref:Glutathione Stransferase n=1 Tax=Perkinsus chesapeaki TaxID=330153 RepID=A0A7J6N336_PERCH|nr:glutathione Stransferase [Perkinsus chesapeaki]
MAQYKLHYFDSAGAAEHIRMAFAVSGIEFEDCRIPFAEFPAKKAEFPLGQVPVLELKKDGSMITQGYAILRYVGSLNPSVGLYPADALDRLRVDEVMDIVKDIHVKVAASMKMNDDMKMAVRKALAEEEIPFTFGKLDKMVGDKKFCTGDKMTIADLLLSNMMEVFSSGYIDGLPTTVCDPYTNLKRVQANVFSDSRVSSWKDKRQGDRKFAMVSCDSAVVGLTCSLFMVLKLHYFDAANRGEPIRLAFAISGIKFDDVRVARGDWAAKKAANIYPMNQLPVLEFEDGTMASQSTAILRYVGSLNPSVNLYPDDPRQRLRVDEMLGIVTDVRGKIGPTVHMTDEAQKAAARKELGETTLPFYFGRIEKIMGEHKYSAGDNLTIADLDLVGVLEWLSSGILTGIPADIVAGFPLLFNLQKLVGSHPAVALWREKREVKE